jgi:signal transduction histidine kinase
MHKWLFSLHSRIILATALVVSAVLVLFSFINLHLLEENYRKTVEDGIVLLGKEIDASIENKKRLHDPELLKREVNVIVESNRGVDEIHIFLLDPKPKGGAADEVRMLIDSNTARFYPITKDVISKIKANEIYLTIIGQKPAPRFMLSVVPLHSAGRVIGGIGISAPMSRVDKLLEKRKQQFMMTTVLAVGILILFMSILLRVLVTTPVQKLLWGMQKVEAGDLAGVIPSRRKDELGQLIRQFNQMVRELQDASGKNKLLLRQVEELNQNLQKRVDATTLELRQRNQELQDANERLISLQRRLWESERLATLGQVVANIAHEIGSPLGAVSGHIQILKSDELMGESQIKRLELIDNQLNRVVNIIQQMLNLVRARTPEALSVHVNEVVKDVLFLLSPMMEEHQVKVEQDLPENLPAVAIDPDSLQQVLINLLTNAIDAMPQGGLIEIYALYFPSTVPQTSGWVEIGVHDNGMGIAEELQKKIFDPFYTTKPTGKGTGLGLALCKDIIERYQGSIRLDSSPGKGTVFYLKIPEYGAE